MSVNAREVSERYRSFADTDAAPLSAQYAALARAVAADERLCGSISELPARCHQPNLFLAAVRFVTGSPPGDDLDLAARVSVRWEEIREVMLTRYTQTNEAGRCAALLFALQGVEPPLALVEIGASAGLCLLPDRYRYRYRGASEATIGAGPCVLDCELQLGVEPPGDLPRVVWRAGLDQNPLSVTDPSDVQWLRSLVWPDMPGRARRLDLALDVAREDPPRVVAGDLLTGLPDLLRQVPDGATPVVVHSATLSYVDPETRGDLLELIRRSGAVRVGLEPPGSSPACSGHGRTAGTDAAWGVEFVVDRDEEVLVSSAPYGSWVGPPPQHG